MRNQQATQLLFELTRRGRRAHQLPPVDLPVETPSLPADQLASQPPPLPEEVVAGTRDRYLEAYRRLTGSEPEL